MQIFNLFQNLKMELENYGPRFSGAELKLSQLLSAKNLGFHLEVLDPKTFSSPYHWHDKEEELCIVIEGEAILRKNNEFKKVRAGDLIYHGTGLETAHHMFNHTDKPFKFFALSTRAADEICGYPDSRKTLDRKNRKVTQDGVEVDYWKDEEDPTKYWPAHALKGDVP